MNKVSHRSAVGLSTMEDGRMPYTQDSGTSTSTSLLVSTAENVDEVEDVEEAMLKRPMLKW